MASDHKARISSSRTQSSQTESQSSQLSLANSHVLVDTHKMYSVLPFFGFINITISSGTTIYRAYNNGDIPMIAFIAFVYIGSFLLEYWFRLYHNLPKSSQSCEKKKRNLKIGIWVLFSTIMFGFACEFSTFMSPAESLCFFGVVIGGNSFLFYLYFIWKGDKKSGGKSREAHDSHCNNTGNVDKEENTMPLTEGADNV